MVRVVKVTVDENVVEKLKKGFIALDVETTGCRRKEDRVIEIGCMRFIDMQPKDEFTSLINIERPIPYYITSLTGITNRMIQMAPGEEFVYPDFTRYFRDVLEGNLYMVAHNASFDAGFISEALTRLGYSGVINYVDTLTLSRRLLKSLPDHKLGTVTNHFGLVNCHAHRAYDDAKVCGEILVNLINLM